jgi:glucose/arabinose dehydrogenase
MNGASSRVAAAPQEPGFQETVVFSGLDNPTVIQFSPDGRVFVAEKRGVIKVFDSLTDPTPDIFADLNVNVYNFWDRGLLGLALDPNFPATPYVYVLYSYDAVIGGTAPRWGTPGVYSDPCPSPPGATGDGCVVSGRLSRLEASGNVMVGSERVLIEDWCQQYPSHSVGGLAFGADGALYVSGGDGASFNFVDYGQDGNPLNPCGDPPGGAGGTMTPPTAEGGALRSQDLRTRGVGDPVTLDGAILRVDPATGNALPDNPLFGDADPNARRIIAYGLRNPFRITIRPGTNEVWIGDVGWSAWEEINRVIDPTDATVENFGWPCYEGPNRQSGYDGANLNICETLYASPGAVTAPYMRYHHQDRVVPNENCPTGSSSIAGVVFSFYNDGPYPDAYDGALFFADYSRDCIWVAFQGGNGLPNPSNIRTFIAAAANPVDLKLSPNGELFYVDFDGGTIRRVAYIGANQPPIAVATVTPTSGAAPLTVTFDGGGSSDPDTGDTLTYAWDLDGDGQFDDSAAVQPVFDYNQPGTYTASLQVTDSQGATGTDVVVITVGGNTPPTAVIETPVPGTTWKVGDVIAFSGSGIDAETGTLPASALSWTLILHHCPANCHTHGKILDVVGVASGEFTAPDHEYPSFLELSLTVTDAGGLQDTTSLQLDPQTVALTFRTKPGGFALVVGGSSQITAFSRTVIVGSRNSISAPSPQSKGRTSYTFVSWSDGGAQSHDIIAPATPTVYIADYSR